MSVKLQLDLVSQAIRNEYRILVLEHLLETILNENPEVAPGLEKGVLDGIRRQALDELRNKYPDLEIESEKMQAA